MTTVGSVGHELEFAVRQDKRHSVVLFEVTEMDALIELDVLQLNRLAAREAEASDHQVSCRVDSRIWMKDALQPMVSNITSSLRPSRSSGMHDR